MDKNINNRIKELMKIMNYNQLSFSKQLGYSSSEKISRLFRSGNHALPSYDIIYDISNKFEINLNWLITGDGQMYIKNEVQQHKEITNDTDIKEKMHLKDKIIELQETIIQIQKIPQNIFKYPHNDLICTKTSCEFRVSDFTANIDEKH